MISTVCDPQESRIWPFTIRISLRERRLLQLAAIRGKQSRAAVVRTALDPLLSDLAGRESEPPVPQRPTAESIRNEPIAQENTEQRGPTARKRLRRAKA